MSEEKINLTEEEFEAEYEYGYGYGYKKSCDIKTLKQLEVDLRVLQPYRRIYNVANEDDFKEIQKRFTNFDELLQYFADGKILAVFEAKEHLDVLVYAKLEGEGYLPFMWRVMCV
jgi:hypothetical protein